MFSKSAIGHGTASLAHELLPLGIRVNGIAPGYFFSELTSPGSQNELGLSQFEAMPQPSAVDPGDWGLVAFADGEPTCAEEYNAARQEGHLAPPEEHDFEYDYDHDATAAATPSAGLGQASDAFQGMFASHEHMNW